MRTILTILLLFPILLFSQDPGWEGAANTRFATPTYLRLGDSSYFVTPYTIDTLTQSVFDSLYAHLTRLNGAEVTANKTNVTGTSTTLYATQNLVKTYADSIKGTIPSHATKQDSVMNPFMFSGGNIVPRNGVTTIPYSSTLTKAVIIDTVTGKLYRKTMGTGGGIPVDSIPFVKGSVSVYLRDTTDKVGIGTRSPLLALVVGTPSAIYGAYSLGASTPNSMAIGGGSTGRIFIQGTTQSDITMQANAAVNAKVFQFINKDSTLRFRSLKDDGNVRIDPILGMTSSGNVGIGTTAPDEKLVVVGASTTGKYTSSGWTHSSDSTLKTNIKDIKKPLKTLNKLQGVEFIWKAEAGTVTETTTGKPAKRKQLGFIAQEVQKVYPDMVLTGQDGQLSMAYEQLIPLLLEAIKEQDIRIDDLEKRLLKLEAKLK